MPADCRGSAPRCRGGLSLGAGAATALPGLLLAAARLPATAAFGLPELPLRAGAEDWPVHHVGHAAILASNVSAQCSASLKEYLLCGAVSGLFSACSNDQLLNSSKTLRQVLGCDGGDEKLPECKKQCIKTAQGIMNETLNRPCHPEFQAMHGFGAQLDIFTMGQVDDEGVPKAVIMPLPNMKNMAGPTLIKFGEPAHCAEIPSAQYCVISGSLQTTAQQKFDFNLGNCLPSACTEDELRSVLNQSTGGQLQTLLQCGLVFANGPAEGPGKQIEAFMGWGGVPVHYPNNFKLTVGAALTGTLVVILATFMVLGTWLEWSADRSEESARLLSREQAAGLGPDLGQPLAREEQELANAGRGSGGAQALAAGPLGEGPQGWGAPRCPRSFESFVNHWSLLRNTRSLGRLRKGDKNPFACIDFLKTFSMCQVILGHSYFYIMSSAGFANMEQFTPPYGLLGSAGFQIIPGCFYGVDSFFVISGFLCAIGLEAKLFRNGANRRPLSFSLKYLQFLFFRWLRLVPAEMFCIALSTTLLPYMGTGVLWNLDRPDGGHCYEANGSSGCDRYWWTNLLFIQDMDKFTAKCYGHTWYLANDFQMYATAPFFGLAYSFDRRMGWGLLSIGMLVGVSIPVIMTIQNEWVPEIIAGSTKGFAEHFYFKPWCRCPAFFLGIGLGWAWPSFLERYKGRHRTCASRVRSYTWALLALALAFAATFGRMSFFQCSVDECFDPAKSPVSKFWQFTWAAFGILSWCTGLGIVMILCFQGRFIPLLQNIFNLPIWQPVAKLSYSAYLIHTSVLVMDFCQKDAPIEYMPSTMFFNFVSFTATSLFAAFWIFMLVEKPCANLQMKLLGGGGD